MTEQLRTGTDTYVSHLLAALAQGGDRDAIISGDRRFSFAGARDAVLKVANALRGRGVSRGDAVALFTAVNRPEALFVQFAVHLLGCRLIFVPPEPGKSELVAYVRQAGPSAFVFEPGVADLTQELVSQVPVQTLLSLGPAEVGTDLLPLAAVAPAALPDQIGGQDDIATVFYTGGTTGRPKLVTHRHRYYDILIAAAARRRADPGVNAKVVICTLTSHASGHVGAITFLLAGTAIVPLPEFDAEAALAALEREAATGLVLAPPMLYDLLDSPAFPVGGFPALARIHYSGAPTAPSRLRQAIERFGPVMRQTYGLTEVPVVTVLEPDQHDPGRPESLRSCGRTLPGTEIAICDELGHQVAPGQVGEVRVRGPAVMTEYWGDPERTSTAISDGWLRTGDLGYADGSGLLYLVDRSKDVIITGPVSDNVYSRLLDDFLVTLPGVRHAAAVGVPDERYGEAIHVFVVPEPGTAPEPAELASQAAQELGESYRPRDFTFVNSLPWTPMGKIDKKALRAMATARPGSWP